MAPAPGQLVGAERIEAAIGGEEQQRVGGLRLDRALQPVALLEGETVVFGLMAPDGADPALLGEDDGDRLLLDHRLGELGLDPFGRLGEARAAFAERGLLTELGL